VNTDSWLSISDIAVKVQTGELKAIDMVEKSLSLIDENKDYDAIIVTLEDRARRRAIEIDEAVAGGDRVGRLAGVPFIAKDNFLVFGAETTAASNMLHGFKAPFQATAIEKLEKDGAICVAKANLDAFAHGSSTENSDFFTTKNPYDKTRVPGGSSGGSAAAVALQMAPFATGTDTGSSIRLPASFCGVVGMKPTYGLVSRSGVVAMASSLDVVGPITRSVEDAALVLDVMAGKDVLDSTSIERTSKDYSELSLDLKNTKIGILKEYMDENLSSDIRKRIEGTIKQLEKAGAEVVQTSIPSMPLSVAAYYILCPAEVSSNLSRYDGQRYPYSFSGAKSLEESYTTSRGKGFGKEAKRRIMIGTYVLSSGYYDAYYKQAQTVRTKLINEFDAAFADVDYLVGAITPTEPFKIGERVNDPLKMYLTDLFLTGANLAGVPAISVPVGMINNLPVGIQILAPQRKDRELLALANIVEGIGKTKQEEIN